MADRSGMLGRQGVVVITLFVLVLLLPLVFQGSEGFEESNGRTLVIITPHNEQIRFEFKRAFERWHEQKYGEPVQIAWSVPGGTSEIRRMLMAQWVAALERGRQPGGDVDLVFGGGSYEHGRLAQGVSVTLRDLPPSGVEEWLEGIGVPSEEADELVRSLKPSSELPQQVSFAQGDVTGTVRASGKGLFDIESAASISTTGAVDLATLPDLYGRSEVGATPLWNDKGYWYGTALSSFGLVANVHELTSRGMDTPDSWVDLADPRLREAVSMVNPAQSGSVTTAFETILKRFGWVDGWRVLRRAAANARTFSASSLRGPTDVAAGDAAMGVCIDFFGRYQQQALADNGAAGRIVYVDPIGETMLDPDPISMLANPPQPDLAARFIQFTLSEPGQALWQFDPKATRTDGLGPEMFALRRLPVLDSMYRDHLERFMDPVDPFANASPPEHPDRNMRSFIAPLMQAMAMDERDSLHDAWRRIVTHRAYPVDSIGIVKAEDVDDPELARMLSNFDAMPEITGPDGTTHSLDTPEGRDAVKRGWLRGGWEGSGMWDPESEPGAAFRRHAGKFFRARLNDTGAGP